MGFYSWMYADTDNKKRLKIGQGAYVLCPDGTTKIKEYHYNGYGTFGGNDIYELVAEWNRDYLTEDNLIKPLREEYIDNHTKTEQEAFERALKCMNTLGSG